MIYSIKRAISTVLPVICILMLLVSCGSTPREYVMSYKDVYASEALYSYWMSTYKTSFLYSYNQGIDSDDFWDSLISDDQTYEDYVEQWIDTEMKYRTISLRLFDDLGLKISDEKIASIDADIEEKIDYAGSREAINTDLAKMGMNIDMLRQVYLDNARYDAVYDHLYGEKGTDLPTENEKADYFKENYYCLKYITIYSGANLKTDEEGNYVYDDDGKIALEKLSEQEKKEKQKLIDTVIAGVEADGDFDEYISEFSEVDYSDYPNGFFVCEGDYSRFGSDIVNAAVELDEGGIRTVADETVTYIIKKMPLPEYSELKEKDIAQLETMSAGIIREKQTAYFDRLISDVKINSDVKSKYSIRKVSENSYF